MNRTQNGIILIGIAIVMNVGGRLLLAALPPNSRNVGVAGLLALSMVSSLAVGLFGLFRLISGLLSKK